MIDQIDLRELVTPREPLRCAISEQEAYEVRFEVLSRHGAAGNVSRMNVLQSLDGGKSWRPLRFRRNWWRQWWAIMNDGLGGSCWPPAGEDVRDVYAKEGKFTISYCNLREHGSKGQSYAWEMQYDAKADRWDLALLAEIT